MHFRCFFTSFYIKVNFLIQHSLHVLQDCILGTLCHWKNSKLQNKCSCHTQYFRPPEFEFIPKATWAMAVTSCHSVSMCAGDEEQPEWLEAWVTRLQICDFSDAISAMQRRRHAMWATRATTGNCIAFGVNAEWMLLLTTSNHPTDSPPLSAFM